MISIENSMSLSDRKIFLAKLPFTDIANTPDFSSKLFGIRTQYKTSITQKQSRQFTNDLSGLLNYMAAGHPAKYFSDYVRSRGGKIIIDASKVKLLAQAVNMKPQSNPIDLGAAYAEQRTDGRAQVASLSLPASTITFKLADAQSTPYSSLAKGGSVGSISYFPHYMHLNTISPLFKLNDEFSDHYPKEKVKIAEARVVILNAQTHEAAPMLLRFWWSEQHQEWRPLEMSSTRFDGAPVRGLLP